MEWTEYTWIIVISIIGAFFTAYGIGANDVANAFGSSVAARTLTMRQALLIASLCEFGGAVLLGNEVTRTVAGGIARLSVFEREPEIYMYGMLCALVASGTWLLMATYLSLPVSTTHSTVGAVLGFAFVYGGRSAVVWLEPQDAFPYMGGLVPIVLAWFTSPLISGIASTSFFLIVRTLILRRERSLQLALWALPVLVLVTVFINLFFVLYKGSEARLEWGSHRCAWVSAVAAGGCAAFTLLIGVPAVRLRAIQAALARRQRHLSETTSGFQEGAEEGAAAAAATAPHDDSKPATGGGSHSHLHHHHHHPHPHPHAPPQHQGHPPPQLQQTSHLSDRRLTAAHLSTSHTTTNSPNGSMREGTAAAAAAAAAAGVGRASSGRSRSPSPGGYGRAGGSGGARAGSSSPFVRDSGCLQTQSHAPQLQLASGSSPQVSEHRLHAPQEVAAAAAAVAPVPQEAGGQQMQMQEEAQHWSAGPSQPTGMMQQQQQQDGEGWYWHQQQLQGQQQQGYQQGWQQQQQPQQGWQMQQQQTGVQFHYQPQYNQQNAYWYAEQQQQQPEQQQQAHMYGPAGQGQNAYMQQHNAQQQYYYPQQQYQPYEQQQQQQQQYQPAPHPQQQLPQQWTQRSQDPQQQPQHPQQQQHTAQVVVSLSNGPAVAAAEATTVLARGPGPVAESLDATSWEQGTAPGLRRDATAATAATAAATTAATAATTAAGVVLHSTGREVNGGAKSSEGSEEEEEEEAGGGDGGAYLEGKAPQQGGLQQGGLQQGQQPEGSDADSADPQYLKMFDQMKAVVLHGTNVDVHACLQEGGDQEAAAIHARAEVFDPATEHAFKYLQVVTAICDSFSHGANDVANSVGPLAAVWYVYRYSRVDYDSTLPIWILIIGGAGIVLGLATYGYNIIRAIGVRLSVITPARGFCIELSTALVVLLASKYGLPISTTHCQVGATAGMGLLEGSAGLNWRLSLQFLVGWLVTMLITGLMAAGLFAAGAFAPSVLQGRQLLQYQDQLAELAMRLDLLVNRTNAAAASDPATWGTANPALPAALAADMRTLQLQMTHGSGDQLTRPVQHVTAAEMTELFGRALDTYLNNSLPYIGGVQARDVAQ